MKTILSAIALCSVLAVAVFGQTSNAPAVPSASSNIVYMILSTNDANHVETLGGYAVIPHSFRKFDTAERGPFAGVQIDYVNHTFKDGNTVHAGPVWGVIDEPDVTRNIIGIGTSTDWVKFPNPVQTFLGWLQSQKDSTPVVRAAPIQPAKLHTQVAIITPADRIQLGIEGSISMPLGK